MVCWLVETLLDHLLKLIRVDWLLNDLWHVDIVREHHVCVDALQRNEARLGVWRCWIRKYLAGQSLNRWYTWEEIDSVLILRASAQVVYGRNINMAILINNCATGLSIHRIVNITNARYPWLLQNWNILCLVKINCSAVFNISITNLLVRLVTHLRNSQKVITYSVLVLLKVRWTFQQLRWRRLLFVKTLRLYFW